MTRYILRRLIQAVPTFFGITLLSFLVMTAAPGGPVEIMTFGDPTITPYDRERLAQRLGVNDPWPIQYVRWLAGDDWRVVERNASFSRLPASLMNVVDNQALGVETDIQYGENKGILRLDFGRSFVVQQRSAVSLIVDRLPATLELGIAALFVGLAIGIPVGILSAVKKGGWFDNASRVLAVVLNSIPNFWLGFLLIMLFGSLLGILPMGDRYDIASRAAVNSQTGATSEIPPIWERLHYLLLPTFVLAGAAIAGNSRFMRTSMLDVVNQDFIRTAKSKGLPGRSIWFKHAARNALIPLAVGLGPTITNLWGGAAVTETIFSWPGVGRLVVQSVGTQDYNVVMAIVVFGAIATILGFIISDILLALLDPRIRFG